MIGAFFGLVRASTLWPRKSTIRGPHDLSHVKNILAVAVGSLLAIMIVIALRVRASLGIGFGVLTLDVGALSSGNMAVLGFGKGLFHELITRAVAFLLNSMRYGICGGVSSVRASRRILARR